MEGESGRIKTRKQLEEAGILPEAIDTVIDVQKFLKDHPEQTSTKYGHAVGMLGQVIVGHEGMPFEQQRELLRMKAQHLIEKYGEGIKEHMRPELRAALGLKDNNQESPLR